MAYSGWLLKIGNYTVPMSFMKPETSRINQNASSITAEVNRATNAEGTLSSKITQTAESITAEVKRATEKEGQLAAAIQINAEGITSKVSRDSVVSEINQSAEGLKIRADLLELRGSVEMTGGYVHIDASGMRYRKK